MISATCCAGIFAIATIALGVLYGMEVGKKCECAPAASAAADIAHETAAAAAPEPAGAAEPGSIEPYPGYPCKLDVRLQFALEMMLTARV